MARQYARTGLFGLVCDHMILLSAALMTKGENWWYATMLLLLMLTNKSIPLGLFYDVNCKFGGYFRRWLASQSKLAPAVQQAAQQMYTPLPPFHAYMHSPVCRQEHSLANARFPLWLKPWGETPEQFWKQLELPARVKYMRAPHMKMFVESLIAAANDDHDRRLGDSIAKRIKSLKQMITSLKAEIREFKSALPRQIQVRSINGMPVCLLIVATHKASFFCENL
jgi:Kyakuja-Dileera-Zisupton transposase